MRVSELDTRLTYCLGVSPQPNTAVEIRKYQECTIAFNERWTQVGILFFLYDQWVVIHADINEEGVSMEALCRTLMEAEEKQAQVFVFPYEFDTEKARSMIGTPFSWKKLKAFKTNKWDKIKVDDGLTCAEFVITCLDDNYHDAPFRQQAMQWKPIHLQELGRGRIERLEP